MDVDMLKSSSSSSSCPDAHHHHHHHHHHNMDMMTMMMQMPMSMPMQKQPFPDCYRDSSSSAFSDIDFGWAPNSNPNSNSNVSETFFHNYPNNASLMNPNDLPSSVSFMGSPISAQEQNPSPRVLTTNSNKSSSMAAMREMIFRIAAMQPIQIDPESVKAPKRRNVKISKDPQSVAARHRRERISEKMRILQRLVPGGTKMDTASMLDEAIHYVKFLKKQVQSLERAGGSEDNRPVGVGFHGNFPGLVRPGSNSSHHQLVGSMQMLR